MQKIRVLKNHKSCRPTIRYKYDPCSREAEPFSIENIYFKKYVFILGDITYKLSTIRKQVSMKLCKIKLR